MPFTWTEPISAGYYVLDTELQEIHDYLDHIYDHLACDTHYSQYEVSYDIGVLTVNQVGYQNAENAGELKAEDTSELLGKYTSNYGAWYSICPSNCPGNCGSEYSGVYSQNKTNACVSYCEGQYPDESCWSYG